MTTSVLAYIVVASAAILIGLSKGGLGGTVGVLVAPLLALVMPATDAVGVSLPLLIVGDVIAVTLFWKRWNGAVVRELMPGTIVGVILGSLLLSVLKQYEVAIRLMIGSIVLLYCVYRVLEPRIRQNIEHSPPQKWHSSVFGAGTGVASTVANSGGPIVSIYFIMHRLNPEAFIGTSALYFFILNLIKVPGFVFSGVLRWSQFMTVAWAIPLVFLGVWLGKVVVRFLPQHLFDKLILILLAFAAVVLLIR